MLLSQVLGRHVYCKDSSQPTTVYETEENHDPYANRKSAHHLLQNLGVFVVCFDNLLVARATWEGTTIEKMPPWDQAVGKLLSIFLIGNQWERAQPIMGGGILGPGPEEHKNQAD